MSSCLLGTGENCMKSGVYCTFYTNRHHQTAEEGFLAKKKKGIKRSTDKEYHLFPFSGLL